MMATWIDSEWPFSCDLGLVSLWQDPPKLGFSDESLDELTWNTR